MIISYFKILLRLTRINENTIWKTPWVLIHLLIFPLIFVVSPQNFFSYKTIAVFLGNVFITASGFIINDVEDADEDYHVLEKRKRNPISNKELTKKQGYVIGFSSMIIGLTLLFTINFLVFLLGFVLGFIGILYSLKPIKLKSRPILDIVGHVIGFGVIQISTTYLAFSSPNLQFLSILIVLITFSAAAEIFQELRDFEVDKKTKINNTIQKFGKFDPAALIIVLGMIATLGFGLLFYTIYLDLNIIVFTPLIFLGTRKYMECMFTGFNYIK